jgi:lipopolysaccharide biosynthesis regulator YciM
MFDFIAFDPEKTIKRAEELRSSGKTNKALDLILKALKSNPENPYLNLKSFEYHLDLGKERESFIYFQKAIKSKEVKEEAKRILLENLSRSGLEKHKEHYFEILVEEFKVKEAKEFFKNLERKEIEGIRERYKKAADEIYKREIEKPTRGLLRTLLILSIIEWEYGNYENSEDALKECFKFFPEARNEIIEVIEEETRYGKNRIFANFIIGELFYLFEDEKKGVLILERVLEQDESYLNKIEEIFSEKIPETKEGKKFYIKILLKRKNYKEILNFIKEFNKEEIFPLIEKIDIERIFFEKEILREFINYFKYAGFKNKIIDIFYYSSLNFPERANEIFSDLKEIIGDSFEEEYIKKIIEGLINIKGFEEIYEICKNNPKILESQVFADILNEKIEEIPENKKILEIFALSLFNTKKFEEGLIVTSYIIKNFKEELNPQIISFIENNMEFLNYYPNFYEIIYEIYLEKGKESEKILQNYFKNFPDFKNEIMIFLEDLAERKKEFIEKIIDDIRYVEEKEELPQGLINFLKAELCIKKEYYREAEEYYYKAFKEGIKWVRKRVFEIDETISSPYIKLLKGKILIEDGKAQEGASLLIFALREEASLLKNVANFLRNKMEKEKDIYLSIPYLEILIMQKYYEPALKFAEGLLEVKDRRIRGEILSLYSIALWESNREEEAKKIIKTLLQEKYPFSPKPLIRLFEEKIKKGEKNIFIYQTLGALYLLENKPSHAAMCYFNVVLLNPSFSEKIKNMLIGIEARFPEDVGVKIAKAGIKIISGKKEEGYEEIENIIETERSALDFIPLFDLLYKDEDPYAIFLKALISFHKGEENYIEYVKKIGLPEEIPENLKEKVINLIERGIKKGLSLWDSIIFLLNIYINASEKKKIMEYIGRYGLPDDLEKLKEFKKFFIFIEDEYKNDKSYNFYLGILLINLHDARGLFFLDKSLPDFAHKIYENFDKIKNYKNSDELILKVSFLIKDLKNFKEIFLKLKDDYVIEREDNFLNYIEGLPYDREICERMWNLFLRERKLKILRIFDKILKEEKSSYQKIKFYFSLTNNFYEINVDEIYKKLIENSKKEEIVSLWDKVYKDFMKEKIPEKTYESIRKEIKDENDLISISRFYERKGKILQAIEIIENYKKRKAIGDKALKRLKVLKRKFYENPFILKVEV